MKRGFRKVELLVLGIVLMVSAFTFGQSYVQVLGPFYRSNAGFHTLMAGQAGGRVVYAVNGEATDSLRVGQVVYWSDTNQVAHSSTLAAYNTIAGVVVGGASTSMQAMTAITDTSTLAAVPDALAIVLTQGRTWVLNDGNGAITIGQRIIPSDATSGRSEVVTSAIDTNYRVIGKAVVPAASGTATLADVNIH